MSEWVDSLHWSTAIAFFWAGGIIRTSTIFAIGWYGAQRGSRYHAVNKLMASPLYLKTQQFVHRWGALAVPLCFYLGVSNRRHYDHRDNPHTPKTLDSCHACRNTHLGNHLRHYWHGGVMGMGAKTLVATLSLIHI